jgi:gamma-glutamylcyclotransferase (GGCT)/AIG2-like uncharacterized protein YtfP
MSAPLFVYGTLMVPALFRAVTGTDPSASPALLRGYARRGVVGKNYPVLILEAGAYVEGKICLDVSDEALALIDVFEGVAEGLYCRSEVTVETSEGVEVRALTYVAGPNLGTVGDVWNLTSGERETYFTEVVAPYLEQCRRNGILPVASSIL